MTNFHSDDMEVKTESSNMLYKGIRITEVIRLLEEYKKLHGDHLLIHISYGAGTFDLRHREEIE